MSGRYMDFSMKGVARSRTFIQMLNVCNSIRLHALNILIQRHVYYKTNPFGNQGRQVGQNTCSSVRFASSAPTLTTVFTALTLQTIWHKTGVESRVCPFETVTRICPQLLPSSTYMVINCSDGFNFQSVCQFTYTNGFGILPGHKRVPACDASGIWAGEEPIYRDVTPPKFTTCPNLLVFYADRSADDTAEVGKRLSTGTMQSRVRWEGGSAPHAASHVRKGPHLKAMKQYIAKLSILEASGMGNGPLGHCNLTANCQQGYVVQDFDFDPLLTCSDSRGEFSVLKYDGTLPQCAEESEGSFFDYKLQEYYYFVGDCVAAKEQIRQNFISALKTSLGDVSSNLNCSSDLVEVHCPFLLS
ncbi:hypothetical protein DPMN_040163 [Dreissena polymorpha]|uniref:Sushi domain-containing protein n=1 Tax=Dreissena polymorpha TaxID=45954 RepID=A0A9D4CX69_DREPO|nr:hypothetical protein DPMN_040163 [Dreissena polymorpha]